MLNLGRDLNLYSDYNNQSWAFYTIKIVKLYKTFFVKYKFAKLTMTCYTKYVLKVLPFYYDGNQV